VQLEGTEQNPFLRGQKKTHYTGFAGAGSDPHLQHIIQIFCIMAKCQCGDFLFSASCRQLYYALIGTQKLNGSSIL
jgi:hypothetical protein